MCNGEMCCAVHMLFTGSASSSEPSDASWQIFSMSTFSKKASSSSDAGVDGFVHGSRACAYHRSAFTNEPSQAQPSPAQPIPSPIPAPFHHQSALQYQPPKCAQQCALSCRMHHTDKPCTGRNAILLRSHHLRRRWQGCPYCVNSDKTSAPPSQTTLGLLMPGPVFTQQARQPKWPIRSARKMPRQWCDRWHPFDGIPQPWPPI